MGSFTPIHSAFPRLTNLITSCYPGSTPSGYSRRRLRSMFEWPDAHSESGGSDTSSVPASPTSSLRSSFAPIPGISRTSSLDSNSYSCSLSDEPFHRKHSEMNPILSELERRSKLCNTIVGCATCGKLGSDYPRCGNCGEMWCSRSCRLRDGKKTYLCIEGFLISILSFTCIPASLFHIHVSYAHSFVFHEHQLTYVDAMKILSFCL